METKGGAVGVKTHTNLPYSLVMAQNRGFGLMSGFSSGIKADICVRWGFLL